MIKILLVEDDEGLGATLQERLQKEQYQVDWACNIQKAEMFVKQTNYDLFLLDVELPDGSGFFFANKLKHHIQAPFLFLSAKTSAEHRLQGYELGAEDYIPKPFHLKEILLRVKHVLQNYKQVSDKISCCGKIIELAKRSIIDEKGEIHFPTTRDFLLLEYLIRVSPRVVSRDEILGKMWGEDKFPTNRTVDNSIVRLRQMLSDKDGQCIRSVRSIGYQWIV